MKKKKAPGNEIAYTRQELRLQWALHSQGEKEDVVMRFLFLFFLFYFSLCLSTLRCSIISSVILSLIISLVVCTG